MSAHHHYPTAIRPTRVTGQAVSTGEIGEAIALRERILAAGLEDELHAAIQDALSDHYQRLRCPDLYYDAYSGADGIARTIAELMDVPYDRAIVAAREHVRGSKASAVLKALRQVARRIDSLDKFKPTIRATAPPSVRLARAKQGVGR